MNYLEEFPRIVRKTLASLNDDQIRRRSESGFFAPVEQAWHLADLEVEGYGMRIAQLLRSDGPHFSDFQGDVVASQRRYIELDLEPALQRFQSARSTNIARLHSATRPQLDRRATQDGVAGHVTLSRISEMMTQHDASHATEIVQLLSEIGCSVPSELREISRLDDPLRRTA